MFPKITGMTFLKANYLRLNTMQDQCILLDIFLNGNDLNAYQDMYQDKPIHRSVTRE